MSQNFTDLQDIVLISKLKSLFKYMSFDKGFHALEHEMVSFSTPLEFNDPYDCSSSLVDVSDELVLKMLSISENLKFLPSGFDKSADGLSFIKHMKDVPMKNAIDKVLKRVKIACFSEKKHNLLMWSHYSRNHTGICIEFDVAKLIAHLKRTENTPFFLKVRYSSKRDSFSWSEIGDADNLVKWLKTKSIDWKYEKEVRLLKITTEDYSLPIRQDLIKHIYLGSRIDDKNEKRILEICKNKFSNVMISKTSLSKKEYILEDNRIL